MNRMNQTHPNEVSLKVIELLKNNDPFQAMDIFDEIVAKNGSSVWN